ncbi:MAG: biopolymer transporter ExbD [Lentisphaerae bacterium]|nr:biopolymer transporter ExbD [Lentisphaerota bacterium]
MRRRTKKIKPSIPTASMGDIAFLLIIFFMICSHFARDASVRLKPPRAADLASLKESPISVAIDEAGAIYIQGRVVADAEAVESGVAALVKDKAGELGRTVMFKCDASVGRERFEPVLDAIARGGGLIAAMGEREAVH